MTSQSNMDPIVLTSLFRIYGKKPVVIDACSEPVDFNSILTKPSYPLKPWRFHDSYWVHVVNQSQRQDQENQRLPLRQRPPPGYNNFVMVSKGKAQVPFLMFYERK